MTYDRFGRRIELDGQMGCQLRVLALHLHGAFVEVK